MRKMLKSKKGFSLVELMIVVVIMGILIAVAVPLYGAITTNAKNKSCLTNVENIRGNARNYYLSNNSTANDAAVAAMMEKKVMPDCPWDGDDATPNDYDVEYKADGSTVITCANATAAEYKDDHAEIKN